MALKTPAHWPIDEENENIPVKLFLKSEGPKSRPNIPAISETGI